MWKRGYRNLCNRRNVLIKWMCIMTMLINQLNAQQFNSDSWISKAHGTITLIPTFGERNSMLMNTYSLFPKWEFTIAAYLYNDDNDPLTDDGYSATLYAKYMFYENKAKTGGQQSKRAQVCFPVPSMVKIGRRMHLSLTG